MERKINIVFLATFLLLISSFGSAVDLNTNFDNFSFETGDFTDWITNEYKLSDKPGGPASISIDFVVNNEAASEGSFQVDSNINFSFFSGGNKREGAIELRSVGYTPQKGDVIFYDSKGTPDFLAMSPRYIFADDANSHFLIRGDGICTSFTYPQVVQASPNSTPPRVSMTGSYVTNTLTIPDLDVKCSGFSGTVDPTFGFVMQWEFAPNCPSSCGPFNMDLQLDNFRFQRTITPALENQITEPPEPVNSFEDFDITIKVLDTFNQVFLTNDDANVSINFNGTGFNPVSFDVGADAYVASFSNFGEGNFDFNVLSEATGFESDSDVGIIEIIRPEFQYLTITPIENINRFEFNSVDFFPNEFKEQIIWRVDSNSSTSETPEFKIFNPTLDGRQYFIFTSSDGTNFAFEDTLTFGSTNSNPIQKIWDEDFGTVGQYEYSFEDTLLAGETKFYKLTYRMPHKHYFTIGNNPDWFETLRPDFIEDVNRLPFDKFTISNFNNIRSILIEPIPDIFGDESGAFEFQFTAHTDINGTNIEVSRTDLTGNDFTVGTVTLTTTPQRFSFTLDAFLNFNRQLLLKTSSSTTAKIFIADYAIVARGFFTKRLEVLKSNNDTLDSFLLNNLSEQFLQEGTPFRIKAEAYDREGVLETLSIQAFLDGTGVNDQVTDETAQVYNANFPDDKKAETRIPLDELFKGIIDISGNASNPIPPRDIVIRAELIDKDGITIAVQSETITFLQYPFFPDDLKMNFFPTEKRRGKHPAGILELILKRPETLEAIDIRIFDSNTSVTSPDFQEILFKDIDFTCIGLDCSFQVELDEFLFEDQGLVTISVIARMTTELLDLNNRLIRVDRRIFISQIDFEIAKIHQLLERGDDTYRNDEEISLVLILRDDEVTDTSDKLDIFMTLTNCDSAAGDMCDDQTIEYRPTAHIYDDSLGLNYYFFRHFYVLDDGSLLPDGNFIGFRATVQDKLGIRNTIVPVLASKCLNGNFSIGFVANPIAGIASFVFEALTGIVDPCTTNQFDIVTTTQNNAQEVFLDIDEDHDTSSPTQEGFICLSPDSNNILNEPFKQDFICAIVYTLGEKPIDNFRMRITNVFSDVRKEGPNQSFLEFNYPFEVIAYNDIFLLQNELRLNQNTTVDTIGEFIFEGFRQLVKTNFEIFGLDDFVSFNLQNNTISNLGGDIDFDLAFSPQNITGIYFIKIKGLPVLNMQDFRFDPRLEDDFTEIPPEQFLEVLAERNVPFNGTQITKSEIFTTSFNSPISFESEGVLLINEAPSSQQINRQNLSSPGTNFNVIPSVLTFSLQNTMFFNNFSEQDVLTGNISVTTIIKDRLNDVSGFLGLAEAFINEFIGDPINVGTDFLFQNIVLIMILIGLATTTGLVFVLWTRR